MLLKDLKELRFDETLYSRLERWGEYLYAELSRAVEEASTVQREDAVQEYESYERIMQALFAVHETPVEESAKFKLNPVQVKKAEVDGVEYMKIKEGTLAVVFQRHNNEWIFNHVRGRNGRVELSPPGTTP